MMTLSDEKVEKICELMGLEFNDQIGEQLAVIAEAMQVYQERDSKYKGLWRKYGWLGTVLHMSSKASRVEKVFWEGDGKGAIIKDGNPNGISYDYDDAIDLINYACFFVRNLNEGNKRG